MKPITDMFLAIALGGRRVWFASPEAHRLYDMPLDWVAWAADWTADGWVWPEDEGAAS